MPDFLTNIKDRKETTMECLHYKDSIDNTKETISNVSFSAKSENFEDLVNAVLDKILEVKSKIVEETKTVTHVINLLDSLTWYDHSLDDNDLKKVNETISIARGWKDRMYELHNTIQNVGIDVAVSELADFKSSLEDLEEVCEDLDNIFFKLPNDKDFQSAMEELKNL